MLTLQRLALSSCYYFKQLKIDISQNVNFFRDTWRRTDHGRAELAALVTEGASCNRNFHCRMPDGVSTALCQLATSFTLPG